MFNAPLVLTSLAWLGLLRRRAAPGNPRDARLLAWVIAGWTLGTALPAVALTFPATRSLDSAGLMLAAWPLYLGLGRRGIGAGPGRGF